MVAFEADNFFSLKKRIKCMFNCISKAIKV